MSEAAQDSTLDTEAAYSSASLPDTATAVQDGKAVIDGGATKTVASVAALEALMRVNRDRFGTDRVLEVDKTERPVFAFGNSSQDQCLSTAQIKVTAGGSPGQLRVHALDRGHGPILLSIDTLRALGATIDFESDIVVFRRLNSSRAVRLERSSSGHQLISLSDDLLATSVALKGPLPSFADLMC